MSKNVQTRMMVYAALMGALTAVGAYIAIPIGPVPIVLQNLFIYLSGLLLGRKWGLASVAGYLVAGATGLPIFAGGSGGIARFVGPTGGYLVGFLPAVYFIGLLTEKKEISAIRDAAAMIVGTVIIYACGITWLKLVTGMTLVKTLAVGMVPFIIGDVLKIAAAIPIARTVRPFIQART